MAITLKALTGALSLYRTSVSSRCIGAYLINKRMASNQAIDLIPFSKDFVFRQSIPSPLWNITRECIEENEFYGSNLSVQGKLNVMFKKQQCIDTCFFIKTGILFDTVSSTYTYLVADASSRDAVLIDPVIEHAERDRGVVRDLGLNLLFVINTHMHADHITGTGLLKKLVPGCKSIISEASGAKADIYVHEGDEIKFGRHALKVLSTPGHTNGCVTYHIPEQGCAFTGDALLIRGCGRTDFQEGDPARLYHSVHNKIFSMPLATRLYPAHDYKGMTVTSVDEEKRLNPRLTKSLEQFVEIMNNLGLAYPKMIDKAIPANKVCGVFDV